MTKLKTFLLLFIFILSNASCASLETAAKTEVEFKINLTQKGYEALKRVVLNKFNGEVSERTDIYFDIFKDNNYVLKKSTPSIKLRFQISDDDFKWQAQQTLLQDSFGIFSMKKTKSISMEPDSDAYFLKSVESYHELLSKGSPEALKKASQIQKDLDDEGILDFNRVLCANCTQESKYYSTHINHKKRAKMKLKLQDDSFTIQVGETNNNGVITYELEAEVKKLVDLKLSSERLHNWLITQGMSEVFIENGPSIDPTLESELALQKLHSL